MKYRHVQLNENMDEQARRILGNQGALSLRLPVYFDHQLPKSSKPCTPRPKQKPSAPVKASRRVSSVAINGKRKRRLSGASDTQSGQRTNCKKKSKYDHNGKSLQVAIRTGIPIGKEGAARLKKKREEEIIELGINKAPGPPAFTSNPESKTVRINLKTLPFISIRLNKCDGPALIEQTDIRRPRDLGKPKQQQNNLADCGQSVENSASSGTIDDEMGGSGYKSTCDKQPSASPMSTTDDCELGITEAEIVDSSSLTFGADTCESDDRSIPNSPPSRPDAGNKRLILPKSYSSSSETSVLFVAAQIQRTDSGLSSTTTTTTKPPLVALAVPPKSAHLPSSLVAAHMELGMHRVRKIGVAIKPTAPRRSPRVGKTFQKCYISSPRQGTKFAV